MINAFEVPKLKYNEERKKYAFDNSEKKLLPDAGFKAGYLKDR